MFTLLLVLLILDGFLLAGVVLLQAGQGGGLASLGGGSTEKVLGGRQATTVLTKATWISGGVLLALSLILSVMSGTGSGATSEVQRQLQQGLPAAPAPLQAAPIAPTGDTPPPAQDQGGQGQ